MATDASNAAGLPDPFDRSVSRLQAVAAYLRWMASEKVSRDKVIEAIYDAVDGTSIGFVNVIDVGTALGLSSDEAKQAADGLVQRGFLAHMTQGGAAQLTTEGVRYVEELRHDRTGER